MAKMFEQRECKWSYTNISLKIYHFSKVFLTKISHLLESSDESYKAKIAKFGIKK